MRPTACRTSPTPTATAASRSPSAATLGVSNPSSRRPRRLPAPAPGQARRSVPGGRGAAAADRHAGFASACARTGCRTGPTRRRFRGPVRFLVQRTGIDPSQTQSARPADACSSARSRIPAARLSVPGHEPDGFAVAGAAGARSRRLGRRRRLGRPGGRIAGGVAGAAGWPLDVVVVLAAGAVATWRAGVFSRPRSPGSGSQGLASAGDGGGDAARIFGDDAGGRDAGVRGLLHGDRAGRRDADLAAVGRAGDPAGQVLYRVVTAPGGAALRPVPAWRRWSRAITGQDVAQLNHDLVALGYAAARRSPRGLGYFGETAHAVERLEEHLGVASRRGRCRWARRCSSRGRCGSAR